MVKTGPNLHHLLMILSHLHDTINDEEDDLSASIEVEQKISELLTRPANELNKFRYVCFRYVNLVLVPES